MKYREISSIHSGEYSPAWHTYQYRITELLPVPMRLLSYTTRAAKERFGVCCDPRAMPSLNGAMV